MSQTTEYIQTAKGEKIDFMIDCFGEVSYLVKRGLQQYRSKEINKNDLTSIARYDLSKEDLGWFMEELERC